MHSDLRLAGLSALSRDTFYVRATSRAHEEESADMTVMLRYRDNVWANYEIDAPVVSHCAVEIAGSHVFSLTPFADVHVAGPTGSGRLKQW